MNKFNVMLYLALVLAAVLLVADAGKSKPTPQPIDVEHFGSIDVIENGIPNYAASRDEPCAKKRSETDCNECCVEKGFNKGYHPKRFDRIFARGMAALHSHCTCVKDLLRNE